MTTFRTTIDRVLNRAPWDTLQAAKILFGLMILLSPLCGVIVLGADDTIERTRPEDQTGGLLPGSGQIEQKTRD
jgi:hypothetical protein